MKILIPYKIGHTTIMYNDQWPITSDLDNKKHFKQQCRNEYFQQLGACELNDIKIGQVTKGNIILFVMVAMELPLKYKSNL